MFQQEVHKLIYKNSQEKEARFRQLLKSKREGGEGAGVKGKKGLNTVYII